MGRKTILIVEDYEDTRFLLKIRMEACGYEVIEAADGSEAVEIVKGGCPYLILMEMSLPVVDGLTATRLIHEMEWCCQIPIIAVTAHHASEYKARALSAGCIDFVEKPIDFARLEAITERHLFNTELSGEKKV